MLCNTCEVHVLRIIFFSIMYMYDKIVAHKENTLQVLYFVSIDIWLYNQEHVL